MAHSWTQTTPLHWMTAHQGHPILFTISLFGLKELFRSVFTICSTISLFRKKEVYAHFQRKTSNFVKCYIYVDRLSNWHNTKDTAQHKKTQNECIFLIFFENIWKKNFFFEIFFASFCVMLNCVVSYWYDATHLYSLYVDIDYGFH